MPRLPPWVCRSTKSSSPEPCFWIATTRGRRGKSWAGARPAWWISWRGVKTIRIEATDTDLRLSVAGRTWINSDGRRNMPSGEIFTGPLEDSAPGRLQCGFPVCRDGREIAGIELELDDGKVVERCGRSRRRLPAGHARCSTPAPPARRAGAWPQRRHRSIHRQHPLRREDRRDGPPASARVTPRPAGSTTRPCTGT